MKLTAIVATDKQGAIGKDGDLPWHCREDLQWFKDNTEFKTVVMGRKTYESIGRPLPKRVNIVVTRDPPLSISGALAVSSKEELLKLARNVGTEELVIMGGGEIYREFLDVIGTILLTRFEHDFKGDTFFPELNPEEWTATKIKDGETSTPELPFSFWRYDKTPLDGM